MDERVKNIIISMIKNNKQEENDEINWVFTGGVSINLILNYNYKSKKLKTEEKFSRINSDIDIYNFRINKYCKNQKLTLLKIKEHEHPHIIKTSYEKNYLKEYYYIDSLYDYHFDFILPTKKDIIEIEFEKNKILSLSPEYLIIFKCFGYKGFRAKDFKDSIRILNTININKKRLWTIFKKTKYFKLIENKKIINEDNLELKIKNIEIFEIIEEELKKKIEEDFFIKNTNKIPYQQKVIFLNLKKLSTKKNEKIEKIIKKINLNKIDKTYLKVILIMLTSNNKNFNSDKISEIIKDFYLELERKNISSSEFFKIFQYARYQKNIEKINKNEILDSKFLTLNLLKN